MCYNDLERKKGGRIIEENRAFVNSEDEIGYKSVYEELLRNSEYTNDNDNASEGEKKQAAMDAYNYTYTGSMNAEYYINSKDTNGWKKAYDKNDK